MQTFPDPLLAENPEMWTAEQQEAAREWLAGKHPAQGDKSVTIVLSRIHPDDTEQQAILALYDPQAIGGPTCSPRPKQPR